MVSTGPTALSSGGERIHMADCSSCSLRALRSGCPLRAAITLALRNSGLKAMPGSRPGTSAASMKSSVSWRNSGSRVSGTP